MMHNFSSTTTLYLDLEALQMGGSWFHLKLGSQNYLKKLTKLTYS